MAVKEKTPITGTTIHIGGLEGFDQSGRRITRISASVNTIKQTELKPKPVALVTTQTTAQKST